MTTIPLTLVRPIAERWSCQRSGDCCTQPKEIVMTREERMAVLRAAPDHLPTQWRDVDERMVALKANPCPFFLFKECTVYTSRPYNCRRFACMRPDPKTEAFELNASGDCVNFWERMAVSRVVRRLAVQIQRKAQRWALAHGWSNDENQGPAADGDSSDGRGVGHGSPDTPDQPLQSAWKD